ncbi:hypothetical protein APD49_02880 [Acinetobacter pittii]|nr:hypothetical protein APD49_02880 [Acinetobacter pittii]
MRIPVSKGRVDAQAQMQTFTPNTGLAEIGRSIGGALEARSEKLREEQDKTEKADFALQSSKIGADISVVDNDLLLKMQSGELTYDNAVKQRQESLESIKTQYKNVVPFKAKHLGMSLSNQRLCAERIVPGQFKLSAPSWL